MAKQTRYEVTFSDGQANVLCTTRVVVNELRFRIEVTEMGYDLSSPNRVEDLARLRKGWAMSAAIRKVYGQKCYFKHDPNCHHVGDVYEARADGNHNVSGFVSINAEQC